MKGELAFELEEDGIEVIYSPKQSRLDRYLRAQEVAEAIKTYRIDVVHTHATGAFIDGFIATRFARVPVFINTDHNKKYPIPRRYMLGEKVASIFADRVVAVSNHIKNDLVTYEHISPDKIDVIYNGIDFPKIDGQISIEDLRNEFGIRKDEKVVGCISRLDDLKGYDLFIDAAALILKEMPDVRFLIVGGGPAEEELKKQVSDRNIKDRFTFTGWRLDAWGILQLFDVFLLTSKLEGMPIVLLEAMASRKPIVATSVGGVPEMVDHDKTGFIVQNRDPGEVRKYVLAILKDKELKEKLGNHSVETYERKFRAEPMVQAYQHLYESILLKK
jgi:glycosyltransferase involved in cell wall biosynthesis